MRVLFYSTKKFERPYLESANTSGVTAHFEEAPLSEQTVHLCEGFDCISVFTADDVSAKVIDGLARNGVKYIAVRAAGYDNIDLIHAANAGIQVANVPEYSPYAIAEHAVAMMLAMNRKLILANELVHRQDFTLDRLVGFDMHNRTVGVVGTGRTGGIVARIMHGFGCRLLGYDVRQSPELTAKYNLQYTSLEKLCNEADIITIHAPLNTQTKYLINRSVIMGMKEGVMIVNTSRGAVIKTEDIVTFLENGKIGFFGMDVYEKERGIFFFDHSGRELNDPLLKKLLAMPNVLVTAHQAFATHEALTNIADTTYHNINCWLKNKEPENLVRRAPALV
jgi:D-lactate dehydrogenase